ncbi:MAG: hypothetical protein AAGA54_10270 [Myxococcota bacterium]
MTTATTKPKPRGFDPGELERELDREWSWHGRHVLNLRFVPNDAAVESIDVIMKRQPERWLRVHTQDVRDLAFLAKLASLRRLEFDGPALGTRLPLMKATEVCYAVHECDLETVASISGLERLTVKCDKAVDLSPLAGLGSLRELTVVSKRSTKCKPLEGMHLRKLTISGSASGLDVLRTMPKLEELQVKIGKKGLAPLGQLPHVQTLRLSAQKGAPIDGLDRFPALVWLAVGGDCLDHAPVRALEQLVSLEIGWHKAVTDLQWLGDKPRLEALHLQFLASLRSLEGIEALPALRTFGLSGRLHSDLDLAPVIASPSLRKVTFPNDGAKRKRDEAIKALSKRSVRVSHWTERDGMPLAWRKPLV